MRCEMQTVLCYGDSNTYGYNPELGRRSRYNKDKRWPTILQNLLGSEFEVIAEGLNGRTTAYDRPGFPWKNGVTALPAIMGSHKPIDYLVFMLGTNDCNLEMGLSSEDIASGMETLVQTAGEMAMIQQERIPTIIVISPSPILEDYESSPFAGEIDLSSVRKSREIANLYKNICIKYNCIYIDGSPAQVSTIDSEHLTEQGHETIAQLVYNKIQYNNANSYNAIQRGK